MPAIPKPTQAAYAIFNGKDFRATDRKMALNMYVIPVITDGNKTLKPFEYFIATAQMISNIPAISSNIHFITYLICTGMIKQIKSSSLLGFKTVAERLAFKPIITSSLSMIFKASNTNL